MSLKHTPSARQADPRADRKEGLTRPSPARRNEAAPGPPLLLSEEELSLRRETIGDLLGAMTAQAKELHRFLAGAGFGVGLVDRDGYLVELVGDRSVLEKLAQWGCRVGSCWSEEAVGSSAAAISLARGIAVQVEDEDDYPGRMEMGRTCSAAPIRDEGGGIAAVICLIGTGGRVYPHTLGMVSTAAKSIETQLEIIRRSGRLTGRGGELEGALNTLEEGLLTIDREGIITQANPWAETLLSWMGGLKGQSLSDFLGHEVEVAPLLWAEAGYADRELFLKGPHRWVHLLHSLKPITDTFGRVEGLALTFREMGQLFGLFNRLVDSGELFTIDDLVGTSKRIRELRREVEEAAGTDSPVLLLGEPDTGRAITAQAIHNSSARNRGPFITVDCRTLQNKDHLGKIFGLDGVPPWAEGLQGHPGLVEAAQGGTVYFSGVEFPSPAAKSLLQNLIRTGRQRRINGERTIQLDLRVIVSTRPSDDNPEAPPSLADELKDIPGLMRIEVPPLRERSEDVMALAQWIVERCRANGLKSKLRFSSKAQNYLVSHSWPGNLRELERVIWQAIQLSPSSLIRPSHLAGISPDAPAVLPLDSSGAILAEVEKQAIEEVLRVNRFNISKTARELGITRATLYNKLKRYDILPE